MMKKSIIGIVTVAVLALSQSYSGFASPQKAIMNKWQTGKFNSYEVIGINKIRIDCKGVEIWEDPENDPQPILS